MPKGMGYKRGHAAMTRKRRIKPLTAKRKRTGNVKAKSRKY
jgi:hypothetical protein